MRRFVVHSAAAAGFAPQRRAAYHARPQPGLLAANALGWAEQVRAERVVRGPYGTSGYPWVTDADVAEVTMAALLTDDHLGAAYTRTGPAKVTQFDQVRAIAAATGKEIRFTEQTPEQARARGSPRACRPRMRNGYSSTLVSRARRPSVIAAACQPLPVRRDSL